MSGQTSLIMIIIGAALVNNVVLSQFLGICSFLGVSSQIKNSAGLGGAVIFVITIASAVANLLYTFVLDPLGLDYLQTIVFIIVIAALVQVVEMFLKKTMPDTLAIVLLAGIREQLEGNDIPAPIKGAPLVLFCATLMGMAFYGFSTLG